MNLMLGKITIDEETALEEDIALKELIAELAVYALVAELAVKA